MLEQLNQEKLLLILKEIKQLADSNHSLSSKEVVKVIEKMLLQQQNIKSC